jgi:ATP-dependent helicase HrpA
MALFPEAVSAGGWRLDCVYRFDPGKPADGITLKIPVQAASSLPPATLDWAVPGLLREKIAALLRGLPKEFRKKLMPLTETRDIILNEMPREGALLTALGRFLYTRFGVNIPADRWTHDDLEEHLKLRFSVVDGKDRELAAGRDIAILERGFSDEEESQAFAKARKTWEKSGLMTWDFGDLAESIPLAGDRVRQEVAYPALDADENGVHLRLFRSAPEALRKHRLGVKALFALRFREELRHLRKGIAPVGDLKLWAAAFGGAKALENALCEKVMHDLLEADVRTAEAFATHAEKVRPMLLTKDQEVLKTVRPLLKNLYGVTELFRTLEIANRGSRPFLTFLAGLREELTALLPADFLIRYDEGRLVHIGRYLRALALRAERGAVHLEKALARVAEIGELSDRCREIGEELPSYASEEKRMAIDDLVWMIEEYKVSLFAQELKTPFPISRKRLDARIEEIERML